MDFREVAEANTYKWMDFLKIVRCSEAEWLLIQQGLTAFCLVLLRNRYIVIIVIDSLSGKNDLLIIWQFY